MGKPEVNTVNDDIKIGILIILGILAVIGLVGGLCIYYESVETLLEKCMKECYFPDTLKNLKAECLKSCHEHFSDSATEEKEFYR